MSSEGLPVDNVVGTGIVLTPQHATSNRRSKEQPGGGRRIALLRLQMRH